MEVAFCVETLANSLPPQVNPSEFVLRYSRVVMQFDVERASADAVTA
jgi:hypothetical protein